MSQLLRVVSVQLCGTARLRRALGCVHLEDFDNHPAGSVWCVPGAFDVHAGLLRWWVVYDITDGLTSRWSPVYDL